MGGKRRGDLLASPLVYDKAAEETLVGWLLMYPEHAAEIVSGGVEPGEFHGYLARSTFTAIAQLVERGEPADVENVARELYRGGVADVTKAALVALAAGLPHGLVWGDLARRIREGAARRSLAYAFEQFAGRLATEGLDDVRREAYGAIDAAEQLLRPASADRWAAIGREIAERYDLAVDDRVPSGLRGADRRFGEWPRGALVIVGARTSIGKTSLATTLAVEQARAGRRVSFISVEMDRYRIGQRYVGAMTGLSLQDVTTRRLDNDGLQRFCAALGESLPICTDDRVRTWSQARARVRQHARELGGLDVVFVDYLQLLDPEQGGAEKRYEALGRVSAGLKVLARDLNCVVVALAQLNRDASEREEPRLSDLRESGNLEQDADLVWLLWRAQRDKALLGGLVPLRLRCAKNRYGPTGEIGVRFRAPAMAFLELEEDGD